MVTRADLLKTFKRYFESLGYREISSRDVLPDPTFNLLFVNAGIVKARAQMVERPGSYFSNQICVRISGKHNDLEEIGDTHHMTSFEMMGHFQYLLKNSQDKVEVILHLLNFLELTGIDRGKLYLTYHPEDPTSKLLPQLQLPCREDRTNTWSAGKEGDSGYCVEVYYRDERVDLELWNCVFPTNAQGETYLDSGGGLNRILCVLNQVEDVYQTMEDWKVLVPLQDELSLRGLRVAFDHLKTSVVIMHSRVDFDKRGRGYVLRKLFRRALWHLLGGGSQLVYKVVRLCIVTISRTYDLVLNTSQLNSITQELRSSVALWFNALNRVSSVSLEEWNHDLIVRLIGTEGVPIQLLTQELARLEVRVDWKLCLDSLKVST